MITFKNCATMFQKPKCNDYVWIQLKISFVASVLIENKGQERFQWKKNYWDQFTKMKFRMDLILLQRSKSQVR